MRRTLAVVAGVVVVALVAVIAVVWLARGHPADVEPTGESGPPGLSEFYTQQVEWSECGAASCAWVTVPVDYGEPTGETLRLRVVRYEATGDGGRSLLVNPGGPGGSAIAYAGQLASDLGDDVRKVYDVVGVDPRGVGKSTPLTCLDDAAFDDYIDTPSPPDDDPDAAAESVLDSTAELGEACEAGSGALAGHVSTEEAARDMDVVRALLGRTHLDWFGASYGTQLGATYADLFPDAVGRMVLDGAIDPTLSSTEKNLGQATGFQRALDAFLASCLDDDCPLGDDAGQITDDIADLLEHLDATPLTVGDRELTSARAFYGIAATLYSELTWPALTTSLTEAFQGHGQLLLRMSDIYLQRSSDGSYAGNLIQANVAVSCLDTGDDVTQQDIEAALPRFRRVSPVFGESLAWGSMGCDAWPTERDHPQQPVSAKGAAPILVLGTTRDPATPYEWAQALAEQLESGVLVTRDGDGHTAYTSGDHCITDAVDAYLADGTVPEDGLTCR